MTENSDSPPATARRLTRSGTAESTATVFPVKGRCITCHFGPTLTDERFHNTGVAWRRGRFVDSGRFPVTRNPEDRSVFKTPSLRNDV